MPLLKRNKKNQPPAPTPEEAIATALNAIKKAIKDQNRYLRKYDGLIDAEALAGNDLAAKKYIKAKLGARSFIRYLETIERGLTHGTITTQSMAGLAALPDAIKGCTEYMSQLPDLSALKGNVSALFKNLSEAQAAIAGLADVFNPAEAIGLDDSLFGDIEDEENPEFIAEYRMMEERIRSKISSDRVVKPEEAGVSTATGDLDIEGILEEEKKRK